jgi:hypothetical protein
VALGGASVWVGWACWWLECAGGGDGGCRAWGSNRAGDHRRGRAGCAADHAGQCNGWAGDAAAGSVLNSEYISPIAGHQGASEHRASATASRDCRVGCLADPPQAVRWWMTGSERQKPQACSGRRLGGRRGGFQVGQELGRRVSRRLGFGRRGIGTEKGGTAGLGGIQSLSSFRLKRGDHLRCSAPPGRLDCGPGTGWPGLGRRYLRLSLWLDRSHGRLGR